jgi:hypothetical protein
MWSTIAAITLVIALLVPIAIKVETRVEGKFGLMSRGL